MFKSVLMYVKIPHGFLKNAGFHCVPRKSINKTSKDINRSFQCTYKFCMHHLLFIQTVWLHCIPRKYIYIKCGATNPNINNSPKFSFSTAHSVKQS